MSRFNEHYLKLQGSIMALRDVLTHLRLAQRAINRHTSWRCDNDALYLESIAKYSHETQRLITEIDAILTDIEDRRDSDYEIHVLRNRKEM